MRSCEGVAGFIQAASVAIKTAPIKDGFLTGRGWTYDAMADQTGGESICGMCRCESLRSWLQPVCGHCGSA